MPLRRFLGPLLMAVAMILIGCGGGGGGGLFSTGLTGGGTTGGGLQLTYATAWSGSSQTPTGLSEKVTVTDLNGNVIGQQIVSKGSGTQTISFSNVRTPPFSSAATFTGTITSTSSEISPASNCPAETRCRGSLRWRCSRRSRRRCAPRISASAGTEGRDSIVSRRNAVARCSYRWRRRRMPARPAHLRVDPT